MTPEQQAIDFLKGLAKDIGDSKSGYLSIESTDKEQVINCINVIRDKNCHSGSPEKITNKNEKTKTTN